MLLLCVAPGGQTAVGAENEFLTVPTETFRAQAAQADTDAGGSAGREPLAPQIVHRLPAPTRSEMSRADDAGAADDVDGLKPPVQHLGFGRNLAQHMGAVADSAGLSWVPTPDGGLAAALGVVSPGAKALRVRLAIEGAPRGLEVRVYDAAGTAATVAPVPRHQLPAAEGGSAELWTPTVSGEALTVELYLPPGVEPGTLKVSIPVLSHLDADPIFFVPVPGLCPHTDVACAVDEISDATRRSVANYLFTRPSGSSSQCTGQLLNDADPTTQIPYFLTAWHCVRSQQEASSMEFHWFWERDTCGGPEPTAVTRQTGGATVLAAADWGSPETGVDHMLVRLNSDPPAGVALAGWTTAGTAPGDTAVGVHHPAGLVKKLNRHSVEGLTSFNQDGRSHILTRPDVNLEGGSSGSGLYKRIDGADYLVGVATGISSFACRGITNYYGRFDRFYPRVSRWLGAPASVADNEHFALTRLALVDAATRAEVADLAAGDAVLDMDATAVRSFDIVAETNHEVGRVALTLAGPRSPAHASNFPPYTLFGPSGGGGLAAGSYRLKVVVYAPGVTEADGARVLETEVPFEVTGSVGDDLTVAGLTLAVGAGPRIVELADGAAVTVYEGETVEVRARTSGGGAVGSVAFALSGAGTDAATANDAPFAAPVALQSGSYRIAATPYTAADGGGAAGTALALTGVTVTVAPRPVTGFTLVDAAGGLPDPDVGAIADGDTVNLGRFDGWANVRAELAGSTDATRVMLVLDGPREVARTVAGDGVVSLFGESGGDYVAGAFHDGAYTLTATPYAGPEPRDVLPETVVAFTVTVGLTSVVTGFTLIDAGGAPPDPDFAAITDGATLSLSGTATKRMSVRAELAYPDAAGSVRLELRGPVAATGTGNLAPYLLFGGTGDDIYGRKLPDGTYTLTARPFSNRNGSGDALPERTVTFTLADSGWQQTRVSGFTLIDAQGGLPDPDVAAIGQDATIYRPDLSREHSVRADLSSRVGVGSVWLNLSGPVNVTRTENNDGSPFTVFGDQLDNGDIWGRRLPPGRYYVEARPFSERDGDGSDWVSQTAVFTLSEPGPDTALVTGFTVLDAAEGVAEPDLGTLADGATLDLSSTATGAVDIRADAAAGAGSAKSVVFVVRGPRDVDATVGAQPWRLFGPGGGVLPNGTYTLTATPYTKLGGRGESLPATTVRFTVTGSFDADPAPVAGFTLVDARGGLPDPDLGALADGATVDLSGTDGMASVRAELDPRRADVAGVLLALRGGRSADRIAPAREPVSLFGDSGGDYVAGAFPDGAYMLTARPVDSLRTDGFDDGAAGWTAHGGSWSAADGVYEVSGGREGKALLDGFAAADLVLEADVRVAPGGNAGVVFRASDVSESWNAFRGYYAGVDVGASKAVVGRMDDGVWHRLAKLDMDAAGPWYRLKVVATGPRIEVFVDGAPVLDVEDATYASGAVGLRTWEFAAEWDDVVAARLDDPDGLLPRTAVAFTVTGGYAPVSGFTLLDADGAAEPHLGTLADGATLDLSSTATGAVDIRADVATAGLFGAKSVSSSCADRATWTRRCIQARRGGCSGPAAGRCRMGRTR